MSLFDRIGRNALLALALSAPLLASACTMAPVYADRATAESTYRLSYAAPQSRLDQIVYQELGLRFGTGNGPDVPHLTVAVTASSRALGRSATVDPVKTSESTATAVVTLVRDGKVLFSGTRKATASYTYRGQAFADRAASTSADEQAARALADIIRLTVIAALADQR